VPSLQIVAEPWAQEANLYGLQESDIKQGLQDGGFVRSVVVITRPNRFKKALEHVIWLHPSWLKGFYPFCTHRGRSMRSYKDLDLLVLHCRDNWNYRGGITVRLHNDPKVVTFQESARQRAARRIADLVGNEALLD